MGTKSELAKIIEDHDLSALEFWLGEVASAQAMKDLRALIESHSSTDADVRKIEAVMGVGWVKKLADSMIPPV
jgi:hypothetical protein